MTLKTPTDEALAEIASRCREHIVRVGHAAGSQGAHFGPALSLVEIMIALYGFAVRCWPDGTLDPERDRVVLSKGHGSLALYAALHEFGFIDGELLATVEQDGTALPGQPIANKAIGIEFSSGSLGMGLSFGVGLALSARIAASTRSIYVVMGDGETNEGSVWEAAQSAAHFGLANLTAIVDMNGLQSDGVTSEIMSCHQAAVWSTLGWEVTEVDGHSIAELKAALGRANGDRPFCVLAHTIKGKGVSFMEDAPEWHHGRMTEGQFNTALLETDPQRFKP